MKNIGYIIRERAHAFHRAFQGILMVIFLSAAYFLIMPFFSLILRFCDRGKQRSESTWQDLPPAYPQAHDHQF